MLFAGGIVVARLLFLLVIYAHMDDGVAFSRDPFFICNATVDVCNLSKLLPADLMYVGTIVKKGQTIGFVKDPLEQICQITKGQHLGGSRYVVVDVLNDQVVFSDGHQFIFLN